MRRALNFANMFLTMARVTPNLLLDPLTDPARKETRLFAELRRHGSLVVAFSGGADSAYLAWAAHQALGRRALAVTALSESYSRFDREQAETFVRRFGIPHEFLRTAEFSNPRYVANRPDRCYHCKSELFEQLDKLAAERAQREQEIRSPSFWKNSYRGYSLQGLFPEC